MNQYVENLVAADVVEPCSGQWSNPILLVSEEGRFTKGCCRLTQSQQDSYAMPDTQELLDQLAESEWFTSIDLSSAFWQLPLAALRS